IGEKLNYKKGVAEGYTALALSFYVRGNHASAFENYQKALELYRDLNEQVEVGKILNNIGASFYAQGNYQKSLEYYFNVLEVSEEKGMDILNAKVLNNIGNIYEKLDKPDQALEYYNKSYNFFSSEEGYEREEAYMLLNIGLIYYAKREISYALKYYQQALPILVDIDDKYGISECKKNMGEIYFTQKNFEKALEYLNESLEIKEEIEDKQGIAECFLNIGKIYGELRNALRSKLFIFKSLDIAREIGAKELEIKALRNLSGQEVTLGNYAAALDYFTKYSELKDTILGIETKNQLAELQTKYETEKKEQENLRLQIENELQEQTIQKQLYAGILVIVALLLAAILAIVFFKGRQKQKNANILLAQKNEEIETQRDEIESQRDLVTNQRDQLAEQKEAITQSIEYASQIQSALLPPDDFIRYIFTEYFILNKPRDIVSGDFYWIGLKNNKIIFAVADCTGHGVPGALMSTLGGVLLNEVVNKIEVLQANRILNELKEQVIIALRQSGQESEVKTGMDIALCILDKENKELQFSGACNPLYLIRDSELKEIKADSMPVGIGFEAGKSFTNHIIKIQKGDTIYLFSDGYVDQFGGPMDKKFKYTQFRQLLLNIQDKIMLDQKNILEHTIEDWMNNTDKYGNSYKQVDDILVMGIKF
ncbi:tetratricopeptide repeat protein, partial [bacterium]|nr:tetratricopeptide repeat protein [bacterium]